MAALSTFILDSYDLESDLKEKTKLNPSLPRKIYVAEQKRSSLLHFAKASYVPEVFFLSSLISKSR